jgi:hypothetical protein
MANTQLWLEDWVEDEGQLTVAAVLEQGGHSRRGFWYRMPAEQRDALTHSADPFVAGVLFDVLHDGGTLSVHGQVSPSLLANLEELQSAWVMWRPDLYRRFEVEADDLSEPAPADTSATVMTFSGGVDSCFTAWRHRQHQAGYQQRDLRAGVFVHGFDIPLAERAKYDDALDGARKLLASIGMDCIPMTTNFRQLRGPWEDTHAAGLASSLMLLRGRYRRGLIASSFGYSYLVLPYGSNPLTDGMYSSDAFPIVHDGAGFHRLEKTRAVAEWPEVPKYLRVCWKGNCCRCQKCVSNILYFRIVGLHQMPCFAHDITDQEIVWLSYSSLEEIKSMLRLHKVAREQGITDSWVGAVKRSVLINRLRAVTPGGLRGLFRRCRTKLTRRAKPAAPAPASTSATGESERVSAGGGS